MYSVQILPMGYWSNTGRVFAGWIDHYIFGSLGRDFHVKKLSTLRMFEYKLKLRCAGVIDPVKPGLLDNEALHITNWRYRVFLVIVMSALVQMWKNYFTKLPLGLKYWNVVHWFGCIVDQIRKWREWGVQSPYMTILWNLHIQTSHCMSIYNDCNRWYVYEQ